MTSGPEHYREAQRLAEYAASPAAFHAKDAAEAAQIAQVHATLAGVAAQIEMAVIVANDGAGVHTEWLEVTT